MSFCLFIKEPDCQTDKIGIQFTRLCKNEQREDMPERANSQPFSRFYYAEITK